MQSAESATNCAILGDGVISAYVWMRNVKNGTHPLAPEKHRLFKKRISQTEKGAKVDTAWN